MKKYAIKLVDGTIVYGYSERTLKVGEAFCTVGIVIDIIS